MTIQNVNTKARQIIEKVRNEYGYTFDEMADQCGVATGSIQRWYSTGKAKASKIAHLEKLIENIRLPESEIAQNLIEIYRHIRYPYTLSHNELRDMSGREKLSHTVIYKIDEYLYEKGFTIIIDQDDEGRFIYVIVRKKWLTEKKAKTANKVTLKEYYYKKFEEELEEYED